MFLEARGQALFVVACIVFRSLLAKTDMFDDDDLDAMACMEEEYMREAELERAVQEAEDVAAMRSDGAALQPLLDEADVAAGAWLSDEVVGCPLKSCTTAESVPRLSVEPSATVPLAASHNAALCLSRSSHEPYAPSLGSIPECGSKAPQTPPSRSHTSNSRISWLAG